MLPVSFFERSTLEVAEDLIGHLLCRQVGDETLRLSLTEVEAYDGPEDRASHAHRGQTPRNAVMFGPPGYWYVYLCYGMHWMLNIVTGPVDYPAAILLRGAGEIKGPGRLTKALAIDKALNEQPMDTTTGLWIEDPPTTAKRSTPERLPRIGVDYAGPVWSQKPYRFVDRV